MAINQISEVIQDLRKTIVPWDGAGLSDAQLLEEYISRRDETVLAALVWRHGPMVWGVCRRVLRNEHDAEDAFQATFLVLVRKADSIASKELLANWLYGVAHQTALKARGTAAKRNQRERQVAEMPEAAAVEKELWHELQPLLDDELSRLPEKYRSVIVLCVLEGKTRTEAAKQLGVPEGTVGGWLARARAMLAKRLARHGLAVTGAVLATVLSQNVASACVPAAVVSSTIKAASVFAAGQAAAAGAISVKVAALTEGVLKTMLMTKVKFAVAAVFLAGTVALTCGVIAAQSGPKLSEAKANAHTESDTPESSTELPKEDKDALQGNWQLVSAQNDGVTFGEGRPEMKDTRIVFEKEAFTVFEKLRYSERVEPRIVPSKHIGTYTLDSAKNPKELVLTFETNSWNDKKNFVRRCIYTLEGDTLKLCLSMDNDDDTVPPDFTAHAGTMRAFWTFKREAAPEPPLEVKIP